MQIKILDKVFVCDNEVTAIENVFNTINQLIADCDQKLSCIAVDGVEVFEDYGQYIMDNLAQIKTIHVKVKTLKELLLDAFISIEEYLSRVIPEIEIMANEFNHEVGEGTWNKFTQLLDGLQFILNTLSVIQVHPELCSNADKFAETKRTIENQIAFLQEALENQDRVSIGDILLYEIMPCLVNLNHEITANIENGQVN